MAMSPGPVPTSRTVPDLGASSSTRSTNSSLTLVLSNAAYSSASSWLSITSGSSTRLSMAFAASHRVDVADLAGARRERAELHRVFERGQHAFEVGEVVRDEVLRLQIRKADVRVEHLRPVAQDGRRARTDRLELD